MKVYFLIGSLWTGGAERQFAHLAEGLKRKGHEVTVITLFSGGQYWDQLQNSGLVQLHALIGQKKASSLINTFFIILSVFRLRRLLKKSSPDVLYSVLYLTNLISALATFGLAGICLVWGTRIVNPHHWKETVPLLLAKVFRTRVALGIANSEPGLKRHWERGYFPKIAVVIHNGIDTEQFCSDSEARKRFRRAWRIADDQFLIGHVGRITPQKDLPTFLQAASVLARRHHDLRFISVGEGKDVHYLRRMKDLARSLGLADDQMIWSGKSEDMLAVYNGIDVFCLTSRDEGFANVIGEAMACGVRCIVTDVGDSRYIVGDTGMVVPLGDPTLICNALIATIENRAPGESCDAARARVEKEFSVEKMVSTTETTLKQLIGSD